MSNGQQRNQQVVDDLPEMYPPNKGQAQSSFIQGPSMQGPSMQGPPMQPMQYTQQNQATQQNLPNQMQDKGSNILHNVAERNQLLNDRRMEPNQNKQDPRLMAYQQGNEREIRDPRLMQYPQNQSTQMNQTNQPVQNQPVQNQQIPRQPIYPPMYPPKFAPNGPPNQPNQPNQSNEPQPPATEPVVENKDKKNFDYFTPILLLVIFCALVHPSTSKFFNKYLGALYGDKTPSIMAIGGRGLILVAVYIAYIMIKKLM